MLEAPKEESLVRQIDAATIEMAPNNPFRVLEVLVECHRSESWKNCTKCDAFHCFSSHSLLLKRHIYWRMHTFELDQTYIFQIIFHLQFFTSSVLYQLMWCCCSVSVLSTDWSANSCNHYMLEPVPQLSALHFNLAPTPLAISTAGTSCRLQELNYSETLGPHEVHGWISCLCSVSCCLIQKLRKLQAIPGGHHYQATRQRGSWVTVCLPFFFFLSFQLKRVVWSLCLSVGEC